MYKGKAGVVDDLFTVKRFVSRYLKPDEKVPDKSKHRVITELAKNIRRTEPLPRGACQFCETVADKLVPMPMNVCSGCVKKFIKKSDNLRFLKFEFGDFYCDWCLGRGFKKFSINPWLDKKCMDKLGSKHMTGLASMNVKLKRARERKLRQNL